MIRIGRCDVKELNECELNENNAKVLNKMRHKAVLIINYRCVSTKKEDDVRFTNSKRLKE